MHKFAKYILFFAFGLSMIACKNKEYESKSENTTMAIIGVDSLMVGEQKSFEVNTNGISLGEKVNVFYQSTWGVRIIELTIEKQPTIKFNLSDTLAGLANIVACFRGKTYAEKKIMILPAKSSAPLDAYLGSKSVIADGKDWAMITAIPTDKYGNLVKNGTKVNFDFLTTANTRKHKVSDIEHHIAYQKIYSQTKSGKTFIGVSVDGVDSKEKELLQVADFPLDFKISAEENSLYADARQNFQVKTSIIKDIHQNIVPDGTLVSFQLTDPNGSSRQLNSYTIDGVAEIHLQNPLSAGNLQIIASVFGGGASNNLKIPFQSSFQNVPVEFDEVNKKLRLRIGVLRGKLNQLLPNGLLVELSIDNEKIFETEAVNGYAVFDLTDIKKGKHNLRIKLADNLINKELIIK